MLKKIMKILFISVLGVSIMAPIQSVQTAEFLDSVTTSIVVSNMHDNISGAEQKTLQGGCSDGTNFYFIFQNKKTTDCFILKYDSNWHFLKSKLLDLSHGNDITYDSKNNRLVIVHNNPKFKTLTFVDPNTLEEIDVYEEKLPFKAYSIAYNKTKDQYVMGESGTERTIILDSNFNSIRDFEGISKGAFEHQGMECDDSYIYYIQSKENDYNRLLIYNWQGGLEKNLPIKQTAEGENVFFRGNELYIGFVADGGTVMRANLYSGPTYTVKYNNNGGTGIMGDTVITYGVGANLRANMFTKKGYTFGGWTAYRKSDGTYRYAKSNSETQQGWYENGNQPSGYTLYVYKDKAKLSTTTSSPNDIVTLTAKWIANKFTIIYEPNGGSGSMANTTVTYGASTTLRTNTFKKSGKSFGGWTAYRESDKTWRYALNNSSTQQGWYTEGKQPSGYTKFVYKNGASLATTTSVNNDKVHLYAVWK